MLGQTAKSRYAVPSRVDEDVEGEVKAERAPTHGRGSQAQETNNEAVQPQNRDYRINGNLGTAGRNEERRRERRSNRLCNNSEMTAAEHAIPKTARDQDPQSRSMVDESERNELQPGCLHFLGLSIVTLLSGRSRKGDKGARRRGSKSRNLQHASEEQSLEGPTDRGEVSLAHPQREGYPPQRSSRAHQEGAQTSIPSTSDPCTPPDQSGVLTSSRANTPTPSPQSSHAAPAIFPGADTVHISDGTYQNANIINNILIQHFLDTVPTQSPSSCPI